MRSLADERRALDALAHPKGRFGTRAIANVTGRFGTRAIANVTGRSGRDALAHVTGRSGRRALAHVTASVCAAMLVVVMTACNGGDESAAPSNSGGAAAARERLSAPAVTLVAEASVATADSSVLWRGTAPAVDTPGGAFGDGSDARATTPNALAMTMDALMALAPTNTGEPTVTRTPRPTPSPRPARASSGSGSSGGWATSRAPTRVPAGSGNATATRIRSDDATSGPNLPRDTDVPAPAGPSVTSAPPRDDSLLGQLRRGGLVIYVRHTRTDWNQSSREEAWIEEVKQDISNRSLYDDCDRQRLLNDEGRAQARAIGDAFRNLGIPVGRVITSPWCRTRETAQLAFGGGDADLDRVWDSGYLTSGSAERKHYKEALRGLLSSSPGGGDNTVIVGHMPQLLDATGISLQEAEAAIFRPDGGYKNLAKNISPGEWEGLARNP